MGLQALRPGRLRRPPVDADARREAEAHVAALRLRGVQGLVRRGVEAGRVGGVGGVRHARRHREPPHLGERRPRDGVARTLGGGPRVGGVRLRQDPRELLAADAGDQVARSRLPAQPAGDLAQHRVPDVVAVPVVHGLEAVEVEHRERDAALVAARPLELVRQALVEAPLVRQAREGVAGGPALELGEARGVAHRQVHELREADQALLGVPGDRVRAWAERHHGTPDPALEADRRPDRAPDREGLHDPRHLAAQLRVVLDARGPAGAVDRPEQAVHPEGHAAHVAARAQAGPRPRPPRHQLDAVAVEPGDGADLEPEQRRHLLRHQGQDLPRRRGGRHAARDARERDVLVHAAAEPPDRRIVGDETAHEPRRLHGAPLDTRGRGRGHADQHQDAPVPAVAVDRDADVDRGAPDRAHERPLAGHARGEPRCGRQAAGGHVTVRPARRHQCGRTIAGQAEEAGGARSGGRRGSAAAADRVAFGVPAPEGERPLTPPRGARRGPRTARG